MVDINQHLIVSPSKNLNIVAILNNLAMQWAWYYAILYNHFIKNAEIKFQILNSLNGLIQNCTVFKLNFSNFLISWMFTLVRWNLII